VAQIYRTSAQVRFSVAGRRRPISPLISEHRRSEYVIRKTTVPGKLGQVIARNLFRTSNDQSR